MDKKTYHKQTNKYLEKEVLEMANKKKININIAEDDIVEFLEKQDNMTKTIMKALRLLMDSGDVPLDLDNPRMEIKTLKMMNTMLLNNADRDLIIINNMTHALSGRNLPIMYTTPMVASDKSDSNVSDNAKPNSRMKNGIEVSVEEEEAMADW